MLDIVNNELRSAPVHEQNEIDIDGLKKLIKGDIVALRIPGYIQNTVCDAVSDKILCSEDMGSFNKANQIGRLGLAHFEIDSVERFNEYHDNAAKNTMRIRELFEPFISPIDKLRVTLDDIWPAGANLESLYGRKCFVGICRIIDPKVELLAHNDRLDRDSPDSIQAASLIGQLSANVFVQTPDVGGGLVLWDKEPLNEDEYTRLKDGSYGIQSNKLGTPHSTIEPKKGDLVIFNTRKYHGVAPGVGMARINIGMFIGYRGESSPLTYWS